MKSIFDRVMIASGIAVAAYVALALDYLAMT
jgi:hypothetical protein